MIAGPTASGKTGLAVELAKRLGAEVIGADSLQLYRDVPVTSCQPSAAERALVPHHLVGFLGAHERMTAARFGELARAAASEISARGKRVILAGGTGFYLRAALEGLVQAPVADPALREELMDQAEREGKAKLHQRLAEVDPEAAARLNPNDVMRVVRALEVYALSGVPQTELHRRHRREQPTARWVAIDVPREQLYGRIAERVGGIFDGILAEGRALENLNAGQSSAARAIGIAEGQRHLAGQLSREEALAEVTRETRRYAKRQITWFRAVPKIRWVPTNSLDPQSLARELEAKNP